MKKVISHSEHADIVDFIFDGGTILSIEGMMITPCVGEFVDIGGEEYKVAKIVHDVYLARVEYHLCR